MRDPAPKTGRGDLSGPFVRLVLAVARIDLHAFLDCARALDDHLGADRRSAPPSTDDGASNKLNAHRKLGPMLVDRREAASLLGISSGTIDNLRASGKLASVKLMGRRLYDVADLSAFVAERKTREGMS